MSKHSRRHPDFPFRVKCPDCGARTDWCSIALVAAESWNNRHINDKLLPDFRVGEWIRVEKRLPEDGKWAIWCDKKGRIQKARFKMDAIDHFYPEPPVFQLEEAIAWVPLPKLPEEVQSDA